MRRKIPSAAVLLVLLAPSAWAVDYDGPLPTAAQVEDWKKNDAVTYDDFMNGPGGKKFQELQAQQARANEARSASTGGTTVAAKTSPEPYGPPTPANLARTMENIGQNAFQGRAMNDAVGQNVAALSTGRDKAPAATAAPRPYRGGGAQTGADDDSPLDSQGLVKKATEAGPEEMSAIIAAGLDLGGDQTRKGMPVDLGSLTPLVMPANYQTIPVNPDTSVHPDGECVSSDGSEQAWAEGARPFGLAGGRVQCVKKKSSKVIGL